MSTTQTTAETNPLLLPSVFPRFDLIRPEHVVPALQQLLTELDTALQQLEAQAQPTWEGLVEPLERLTDRLNVTWGIVGHLMGVKNSEELRQAHQTVQPNVVQFSMRLGQSLAIYQGLKAFKAGPAWSSCDLAQQRIVDSLSRDAELAGVGLPGQERERFNEIQQELARLSTAFSNHVLDATKAFALPLDKPEDIEGLPPSLVQLAAQAARQAGAAAATPEHGPWRITLDYPSFGPFLEHSRRRDLREQLYRAFITQASSGAEDNTPLLRSILSLRQEQARLLGYGSFAELSLASKMAPDVATVERFLEELRQASCTAAQQDLEDLRGCAGATGAAEAEDLCHWDLAFWAERLREQRYDFNDEELRPYFPLPRVLNGLFTLAQRLFAIQIRPADGEAPVWHEDVRFFRIYDDQERPSRPFILTRTADRPRSVVGRGWMSASGAAGFLLPPGKRCVSEWPISSATRRPRSTANRP